ncbi:MAG: hypothetical protein OQJ99_03240, partial [Rhodospirillales bacterium]|nr:hypothetical protein [Rhodospirillales bacterium]
SMATLVEGAVPEDAATLPDVKEVGVKVALADGVKCERCWKVLDTVGTVAGHETVCPRCAEAADAAAASVTTA